MKKIEFWKRYLNFSCNTDRFCNSINCLNECPYYNDCISLEISKELAEAYIKRHEGKSKKKDHIRDAKKKVTRPNFRKALKEKKPIKIKLYGDYWKELQEILKEEGVKVVNEYRERERVCLGIVENVFNPVYGAIYLYGKYDEFDKLSGIEYILETDTLVEELTVKENLSVPCEHLINGDSCGNAFEPCDKDCPANPEIPQPIKFDDPVPDKLYIAYSSFIRCYVVVGGFKKVMDKEMDGSIRETFSIYARPITDGTAEWLTGKECYRTLEEAVIVAKKLWGGK